MKQTDTLQAVDLALMAGLFRADMADDAIYNGSVACRVLFQSDSVEHDDLEVPPYEQRSRIIAQRAEVGDVVKGDTFEINAIVYTVETVDQSDDSLINCFVQ